MIDHTTTTRRIALTACLGIAGLMHAASAQSTQSTMLPPATSEPMSGMPTTSSVAIDPGTPRGALKSLISAMEAGDGDKIKSLIATTNPSEDKMVAAMTSMSMAEKKFRDAASTAFGPNAKELTGDTAAQSAEGMSRIDSSKETIDGDKAVVDSGAGGSPQAGTPPLTLMKSGGTWKIPITELSRGVDASTINQRLDDLTFMSTLMNDSATEMSKGTYKTPADAKTAITTKMRMAMMQRAAAATQATTMPAATPSGTPATTPPTGGM